MKTDLPIVVASDGVRLAVRLTPRARKSEFGDVVVRADGNPALAIRIAAPPVEGAANKALVLFLAAQLDLSRSAIAIRSGETSRSKMVFLAGDPLWIEERLRQALASRNDYVAT